VQGAELEGGGVKLRASGPPDMRMTMENRAENVALARQALSAVGTVLGLEGAMLADVKTAVSEACNNVVVHAYGSDHGPLELYAAPQGDELTVIVSDQGSGIQPHPAEPEPAMQGVGLSLIQALTRKVEFHGGLGEGTQVRMTFESDSSLELSGSEIEAGTGPDVEPPAGDISLSACGVLVGPVLSSVVGLVAARSGFSMERLSDAQIVSDAIAAHGPVAFPTRHVHVALDSSPGQLDLRLGPLVEDGAANLVEASAVGGLAPLLERLSDELSVERRESGEEMRLTLRQPG
jgi:serine/threonine-protein kinase RsbW